MKLFLSILIFLTSIMLHSQSTKPVIVIHGGAGTIKKENMTPEKEKAINEALNMALQHGYQVLEHGGTALDAVEATIVFLENSPWFNAGKGAVMTVSGEHELDASIMDGSNLNAGAISGVKTIKNPIKGARLVMEESPHVLLYGSGAELFAEENGLDMCDNNYFTTERVKERWEKINKSEGSIDQDKVSKFGTVGCVALDKEGNIAAGTSTGGMMNKAYNRIGDSPIIGSGTYADNQTCGISCTGHGEYFIRIGVAKEVSDQMLFGKRSLEEAADYTIHSRLTDMSASGGLIGLDKDGNVVMSFNTAGMYRGYKKD